MFYSLAVRDLFGLIAILIRVHELCGYLGAILEHAWHQIRYEYGQ